MKIEQSIDNLIRNTLQRAVRESIAGVLVLLAFAFLLQHSLPGTACYYGCLIVLVATPFTLGVIWSHTLSYRLLRVHPVSDTAFWQEAFRVQARLLRSAPLWYLAPLGAGTLLVSSSLLGQFSYLAAAILGVTALFASVAWLNHSAAFKLDEAAASFLTA